MNTRCAVGLAGLVLLLGWHTPLVWAAVPTQANPGFITPAPSVQPLMLQKLKPPEIENALPAKPLQVQISTVQWGASLIEDITLTGNTVFNDQEWAELTAPYRDAPMTQTRLEALLREINNRYQAKGYITSQAVFDSAGDRGLHLKALEGKIGEVAIEGNHHTHTWVIRRNFQAKFNADSPFNLNTLREALTLSNQQYPYHLDAVLEPALSEGQNTNDTIRCLLKVKEVQPWQVSPTVDNQGRPYVGTFRGGVGVNNQNVSGLGDKLTAANLFARGTYGNITQYTVPLDGYGDELTLQGSYTQVGVNLHQNDPQPNLNGKTYTYSATLSHPWDKHRYYSSSLNYNVRRNWAVTDGLVAPDVRTHFVVAATNMSLPDPYGSTLARVEVALGTANLTHNRGIWRTTLSATRLLNLPAQNQLALRGFAQLTSDTLPIAQDVQIGGAYSVRGYTEGLIQGDSGLFFSAEDRFPLPGLKTVSPWLNDRVRGAVFIDYGQAWVNRTSPRFHPGLSNSFRRNGLFGLGFGIRYRLTQYLTGFLDVGFGLAYRTAIEPFAQPTTRVYFGIRSDVLNASLK